MKNSSRAICALLAAILAASLFSCSEKKDDSAATSGTAETSGVTDTAADTAPAESSSPKYSLGLAADGKFDGIRASDHVKLCDYKGINIPAENCTASDEDIDAREEVNPVKKVLSVRRKKSGAEQAFRRCSPPFSARSPLCPTPL